MTTPWAGQAGVKPGSAFRPTERAGAVSSLRRPIAVAAAIATAAALGATALVLPATAAVSAPPGRRGYRHAVADRQGHPRLGREGDLPHLRHHRRQG
ncbi:hypothetical protein [Streptomyces sp. NPDC051577]|uniref:hypothetical protein n=1 Tax=Streptomyces sp. NPDC051577 TaxID=3155166 RepID=UPI003433F6F5